MDVVFTINIALTVMLLTCEDVHVASMANYIIEIDSFLFEVGPTIYIPSCSSWSPLR